jgi:hypothetical protein
MNEHLPSPGVSRRSLLRGGAAAAAVAVVGLPLSSCTTRPGGTLASSSPATTPPSTGPASGAGVANIHVSRDHYGIHIEPSVAVNPRHPRQLLAACQAAPQLQNPQLIATYLSVDAGATWQNGALPQPPAGQTPASDDVTVAFDPQGRGYLCASRADNTPGGRAMFFWRTDDGGRSFSAPTTLLPIGQYFDHPWIAAVTGQTPSQRNVYIAWAGGAGGNRSELGFTRSTDGGNSFEPPRTILTDNRHSDSISGPRLAAGINGLVCVVSSEAPGGHRPPTGGDSEGDMVAQMVAVCSTDAGQTFAAPVPLGTGSPRISLPGGVIANGSDPTVAATPHGDALYAAYTTHQPGATHSDIVVTASHDRGRTWTRPVTATPHDEVTYFQPNLAINAAGRLGISAFALAHGHVNQVLLVSQPHQLRFQAPLRVTTTAFDPHTGTLSFQKHGAWWIGDYQGITTNAEAFHLMWNDTRTGKLDLFAATVRP